MNKGPGKGFSPAVLDPKAPTKGLPLTRIYLICPRANVSVQSQAGLKLVPGSKACVLPPRYRQAVTATPAGSARLILSDHFMLPTSGVHPLSAYGILIPQGGQYHVIVGLINRQSSRSFFFFLRMLPPHQVKHT